MVRGLNKLDCQVYRCLQTDGEEFILPLGRHTSVFQAAIAYQPLMLFQPLRGLPAWWLMLFYKFVGYPGTK